MSIETADSFRISNVYLFVLSHVWILTIVSAVGACRLIQRLLGAYYYSPAGKSDTDIAFFVVIRYLWPLWGRIITVVTPTTYGSFSGFQIFPVFFF